MIKPTTNKVTQTAKQHGYPATDYSYLPNSTIKAPFDCKRTEKRWAGDCGKMCRVESLTGKTQMTFCHLKYHALKPSNRFKQGQSLGIMGDTGYSFGRHLHLYIHVKQKGKWVRVAYPDVWLNKRRSDIVKARKSMAVKKKAYLKAKDKVNALERC